MTWPFSHEQRVLGAALLASLALWAIDRFGLFRRRRP